MGLACSRRAPATNVTEEDGWEVVGGAAEATAGVERDTPPQAIPLVIDHHRVSDNRAEHSSEFWLEYGRNLRRLEREFATQVQIQSYSGSARTGRGPRPSPGDLASAATSSSSSSSDGEEAPSGSVGEAVASGHAFTWPEDSPPLLHRVGHGSPNSPADWFVRTARIQERAQESRALALRLLVNPARARWLRARLKIALLQCLRRRFSRAGAWLNLHPVRGPVAERVQVDPELRGRISRTWSTCGSNLLPQYRSKEIFGHLRKNRVRPLTWGSKRQTAYSRSTTESERPVSAQDSIHASGLSRVTTVQL